MNDHIYAGKPDGRLMEPPGETTSRFRKRYRALEPSEIELHDKIKDKAEELEHLFAHAGTDARAKALAITHLETAIFWAVKSLTA